MQRVGPHVTVVIPCRNEAKHIEETLLRIKQQSYKNVDVIVADACSSDGTQALVESAALLSSLPIRVYKNAALTIPAGLNLAIRHADGPIIARMDGHCLPDVSYLEKCVASLLGTGAGIVGGRWVVVPGAATGTATAIAAVLGSAVGGGGAAYRGTGGKGKACVVDTVPFGCYWKSTWDAVGGYNERLHSNEDYEFAIRVRQSGARVVLNPEVVCQYIARSTLAGLAAQYWRYGWWKAHVIACYPSFTRPRQMLPLVWFAAIIWTMVCLLFAWPHASLIGMLVISLYCLAIIGNSASVVGTRSPKILALGAAAQFVVHLTWSAACSISLIVRMFNPPGKRIAEGVHNAP